MKIILCCTPKQLESFEEKIKKNNHKIIYSICNQLDESMPVVLRIPDGTFFARVTPNRIQEVIADRADDLKIQTSRLYDVSMEKYLSEPVYRKAVQSLYTQLEHLSNWEKASLLKELETLYSTQHLSSELISNAIKMAIIKTTRGPELVILLEEFGKQEVLLRFNEYLNKYKNRR